MDKALLVIDMQEGFRFPETELILPNLLNVVNKFDGQILFSQFVDEPNSMFERRLSWTTFQDINKQKLLREIESKVKNIFSHKTYNPITKQLLDYISENNIKTVYLSGIYTDVSVLVSAMLLFDNNTEVYVLEDCCNSVHKSQTNNIHISAIESLSHIIGKTHIVNSSQVI